MGGGGGGGGGRGAHACTARPAPLCEWCTHTPCTHPPPARPHPHHTHTHAAGYGQAGGRGLSLWQHLPRQRGAGGWGRGWVGCDRGGAACPCAAPLCACTPSHAHTRTRARTHTHTRADTHTHMHACTHAHTYKHSFTYKHLQTHTLALTGAGDCEERGGGPAGADQEGGRGGGCPRVFGGSWVRSGGRPIHTPSSPTHPPCPHTLLAPRPPTPPQSVVKSAASGIEQQLNALKGLLGFD